MSATAFLVVWIDFDPDGVRLDMSAQEVLETEMEEYTRTAIDKVLYLPTAIGTTFRIRVSRIQSFTESTPESRARWSAQQQALKGEETPSWEDHDR